MKAPFVSYCLRPLFVQKYSINRFFPLSSLFFSSISSEIVGNSGGKIHLWPNFSFEEYILIYVWKIKISRCIIRPRMKRGEMLFLVPVIFPNGTFFVVQHPTTDCVFLFMPVFFFSPDERIDAKINKYHIEEFFLPDFKLHLDHGNGYEMNLISEIRLKRTYY